MHMTSRVTAQVNDGLDVLDILGAAFPAGTVSGAPKVRAMEILAEEEPLRADRTPDASDGWDWTKTASTWIPASPSAACG